MKRTDIFKSLLKIRKVLAETDLVRYFSHIESGEITPDVVAADYQKITLLFSGLNEFDRAIIQHFHLGDLNNPKLWGRIFSQAIAGFDGSLAKEFMEINKHLTWFTEFTPTLFKLFAQQQLSAEEIDESLAGDAISSEDPSLFTLILPEQAGRNSRPERMVHALESVNRLYEVAAQIAGLPNHHHLEVVAIDSGADKVIYLKGDTTLIATLKDTALELWDIAIFFRERNMHDGMEWVLKSLRLYTQALNLEQRKTTGPEQMHIIKSSLIDGAKKFLSTGIITKEIEMLGSYDRAKALNYEHKLLVSPKEFASAQGNSDGNGANPTAGSYTDERILFDRFIQQELQKSRTKRKAV